MQGRRRGGSSNGGRGHGSVSYANTVHVPNINNQEHANYVITDKDRDGVSGISEDQWRSIVLVLNAGKNTNATILILTGLWTQEHHIIIPEGMMF